MGRIHKAMFLLAGAVAGMSLLGVTEATAQTSDVAQGQAILRSVQTGTRSCTDLTASDFELAGEAWMEQALGSAQAHEAMNRLMSSMMGTGGEEQMHQYMGRRATGCGGGTVPPGFGRMMGMMGLAAGVNGPPGAGMMGANGGSGYGPMMGGSSRSSDQNDDGPSAAAMIGMMAVLIGAVVLALAFFRPWRRSSPDARQLLDRRLAAGEISPADYRRAKSTLEGGSK